MSHEKSTLVDVITARKTLESGENLNYSTQKIKALDNLEKSFGEILAVVEAYPELKSDQITLKLMEEISSNEDLLHQKRNKFNTSINSFNKLIRGFPMISVSMSIGLKPKNYFEVSMARINIINTES